MWSRTILFHSFSSRYINRKPPLILSGSTHMPGSGSIEMPVRVNSNTSSTGATNTTSASVRSIYCSATYEEEAAENV